MLKSSLPTSYTIQKQVPGFVRENHEKFVEFLTRYYEYLDQDENINDYIRNILSYIDPDTTNDYLLNTFFDELKNIPKSALVDKRLLAKHIYDLYDAKGTPKAIELLFRLIYDEDVTVQYPSENMLIASDGRWQQERFITVEAKIGTLPVGINDAQITLSLTNSFGTFKIVPTRIENENGTNIFRIFFPSYQTPRLSTEQQYIIQSDSSGNKIFSGLLLKSASKLSIVYPGKFWQIGTIIKIPGTISDTIARITNVDANGSLVSLEILEYGYGHSENQTVTISPFPSKPSEAFADIVYSNGVHTVTLTDFIDYSMNVTGITSGFTPESYYLESYSSDIYAGSEVITTAFTTGSSTSVDMSDVSSQDWLDARTILNFEFSDFGSPRGEWLGDRGKISNNAIRLQDNYYYQLYSYAVSTTRCINGWKRAIELVHPAGLKYFGEFRKEYLGDISDVVDASTTLTYS